MKHESHRDPNVFADTRVGTIKAALLRRLEAAGYFSVESTPSRELEAECYSIQTVKQCRDHVRKVERLAAKYRRTPPLNLKHALANNYSVASVAINHIAHDGRSVQGLALIEERDGLRREFLIPVRSQLRRLVFGKPRNPRHLEYYRGQFFVQKGRKAR
jgi:hypothetical protein